jgi:hypothetical protein
MDLAAAKPEHNVGEERFYNNAEQHMNYTWIKQAGVRVAIITTLTIGSFSSAAFAGEVTGNGQWIAGSPDAPLHGQSACAYSGRQDDPNEPGFRNVLAQAWGLLEKATREFLTSIGMNPGSACNPSTGA